MSVLRTAWRLPRQCASSCAEGLRGRQNGVSGDSESRSQRGGVSVPRWRGRARRPGGACGLGWSWAPRLGGGWGKVCAPRLNYVEVDTTGKN